MNIKKLFFSFFILISSFLVIDSASAITDDMTTQNAFDLYKYAEERLSTE